ncbi:O-antigen ligase family protein [Neomesorhizobium albiziae]|uniref:O-antigen ligase family protein n=1 Tax=Neomesorhizobium albiziae TaxID=335020 RepID=UPI0024E190BC|nr:O-antigen ligase family protein [Mesorhizobium albiziae]
MASTGDYFIAAGLSFCLLWSGSLLGAIAIYGALIALSSQLAFITHSISDYRQKFTQPHIVYYNIRLTFSMAVLLLALLHRDLSLLEVPAKCLVVAFFVTFTMPQHRWSTLVIGTGFGAITSFFAAVYQIQLEDVVRPGVGTNPIRFGMISLTFAAICAVGVVHSTGRWHVTVIATGGLLSGTANAFLSGTRGALIAIPLQLLLLAPALWRKSRAAFLTAAACTIVFIGAMIASDAGYVASRVESAYSGLSMLVLGQDASDNAAVGDRAKLVALAIQLFEKSPIIGVGSAGWEDAVASSTKALNPDKNLSAPFNQAHNQYLNDLATGGLLRCLANLVLLFAPIYLFSKFHPFQDRAESKFSLAGLIVSVSYGTYCLTESLMILPLSAVIHSTLVCYLLCGCIEAKSCPLDRRGPQEC